MGITLKTAYFKLMNSKKLSLCALVGLFILNNQIVSQAAPPLPPDPVIQQFIRQQSGPVYDALKQGSNQVQEVLPGAVLQIEERRRYIDPNELKAKPKNNLKEEETTESENENNAESKVYLKEIEIEGDSLLKRYETDHITNKYIM